MVVKTYRGLLADGAQEKIPLSTKDGSVGYRIVKFQIIHDAPGTANWESIVKLYKSEQSSITALINFTDTDLLGAAFQAGNANAPAYATSQVIMFDRETFNQDIYITHSEIDGSGGINYYLELEQMKLDQTQNMSATLKAIRGSAVD